MVETQLCKLSCASYIIIYVSLLDYQVNIVAQNLWELYNSLFMVQLRRCANYPGKPVRRSSCPLKLIYIIIIISRVYG